MDVFIEFMNKEPIIYICMLEYISDTCPEMNTNIRVDTIYSTSSEWYGSLKASDC